MKFVVERLGGVAAFGVGHLKSRGEVLEADLSPAEQRHITSLFDAQDTTSQASRSVEERYRITKITPQGSTSITLPHGKTPALFRDSVRDTLD